MFFNVKPLGRKQNHLTPPIRCVNLRLIGAIQTDRSTVEFHACDCPYKKAFARIRRTGASYTLTLLDIKADRTDTVYGKVVHP